MQTSSTLIGAVFPSMFGPKKLHNRREFFVSKLFEFEDKRFYFGRGGRGAYIRNFTLLEKIKGLQKEILLTWATTDHFAGISRPWATHHN